MKELLNKYRFHILVCVSFLLLIIIVFSIYLSSKHTFNPVHTNKIESFENLIKDEITVEINTELPDVSVYFNNKKDINDFPTIKYYKDNEEVIVDLSILDSYESRIQYKDNEYISKLKVVDTTPPVVTLGELSIKEGTRYIARHFIKSYYDNSKDKNYSVSYKNPKDANITSPGSYDIALSICDSSKNCTEEKTKLNIYDNNSNKKYIDSTTETEIIKVEPLRYGVKKVITNEVTYSIYDDNSKEEITRSNDIETYDYSGYDHSYLEDMKHEAQELYDSQLETRDKILASVNELRRNKKLKPLSIDKKLSVLATVRAMELAYSGKFSYLRPYEDKSLKSYLSFWTEDIFDFNFDARNKIGENLGYHYSSDESIINAWRNSEKHVSIMLDEKFTKTGIGKYTLNGVTYWVQLFVEV